MKDLLKDLNEPQRQAVTHVDGPLLVLAGAGSGKTRVITRRVAHLIDRGVAPWNILAITFTNKAATEMQERVLALGRAGGATVCTFHSLCARLLREFAAEAGLSSSYSIYDRADQLRLVKEAITAAGEDTSRLTPSQVHSTISNAKNELQTPQEFAQQAEGFYKRRVADIYAAYQRLLAANNALDFDDLLLRTAWMMRDHPDLRRHLSGRYRYVLVDEYQDTNHAQYLLAHGIAMEHQNICVTGDPDQSIYAWRGADISNILEFEDDYPDAVVIRLEENYRSTQPILSAASTLIARNSRRKSKELWTRREGGEPVRAVTCDDEEAEAGEIVRRIERLRREGADCSDVAIFYRLNSLSRVMEKALRAAGVPYAVARGVEFYNRREIKDVVAYLRVLVNPDDDLSCRRILNTPTRGIGKTSEERLAAEAARRGVSLLEATREPEQAGLSGAPAKRTKAFAGMMDGLAADLDRPIAQIVEDVVRGSGYEASLDESTEDGRQARSNIDELISDAAQFDEHGTTLADWLAQVALVSDADHIAGGSGAVTLMTLHAAKGLEFPAVFVMGCEQGLLPFSRSDEPGAARFRGTRDADLEEERRLAFVGMTRAQDALVLTCARRRMIRGRTVRQAASQFLAEMGDAVETEDLTSSVSAGAPRPVSGGGFYADVDERQVIEAMEDRDVEDRPPEYQYLRSGCRVYHSTFGEGRVMSVNSQPWPHTRADVAFEEWGLKRLVLASASLELLDEE